MKDKKSIGFEIPFPGDSCSDIKCPFHGNLKVHGRVFVGRVISDKMAKTVTVESERMVYIPKYERYQRKFSRIKAHVPDCISCKEGDIVKIMETRPLSKTKSFVVVQKIEKEQK